MRKALSPQVSAGKKGTVRRNKLTPIDTAKRPAIVPGYGGIATKDIDERLRRLRSCFEDR